MARNRRIKPEFWCDKKINSCSPIAQLLFIGTWNFADDTGVCRADITYLQSNIFPYTSVTREQIEKARAVLIEKKLVFFGIYNDEEYILIKNFLKHQTIDHPSKTRNIMADYKAVFEFEPNTRRVLDESSCLSKEKLSKEKIREVKLNEVVVDDAAAPTLNFSQNLKDGLNEWYGEYSNVHLTKIQYGKLVSMIANNELLNQLINELSENIASKKEKAKPYDENYPAMHFLAVKKYWDYRKTHPEKFKSYNATQTEDEHEQYLRELIRKKDLEFKNE